MVHPPVRDHCSSFRIAKLASVELLANVSSLSLSLFPLCLLLLLFLLSALVHYLSSVFWLYTSKAIAVSSGAELKCKLKTKRKQKPFGL